MAGFVASARSRSPLSGSRKSKDRSGPFAPPTRSMWSSTSRYSLRMRAFLFLFCAGCGSSQILDDVAHDASFDSTMDATKDAIADATMDATNDATMDATNDATGGDAGPGMYAAYAIIGGLDRLRIAKTV